MFLSKLSKDEKVAFLKVARILAQSDGSFEEVEKSLLLQYAMEMYVPEVITGVSEDGQLEISTKNMDFNTLLLEIAKAGSKAIFASEDHDRGDDLQELLLEFKSEESRRIMLLELMAIVYADGEYHPAEEEIVSTILDAYDFNSHLITIYAEWAKAEIALLKQGIALIKM